MIQEKSSVDLHVEKMKAVLSADFDLDAADTAGERILELVVGTEDDGTDVYAYLAVKPSRYLDYIGALAKEEDINPEDYGEILHRGIGVAPPADVQKEMAEKHGFNPGFDKALLTEMARQA